MDPINADWRSQLAALSRAAHPTYCSDQNRWLILSLFLPPHLSTVLTMWQLSRGQQVMGTQRDNDNTSYTLVTKMKMYLRRGEVFRVSWWAGLVIWCRYE